MHKIPDMPYTIHTESLPIKMWIHDIESEAMVQVKNLANFPFAFQHIAIMPDCHKGFGMPIGGVMATKGVIIPNAVGMDIGCGMVAVKAHLTDIPRKKLEQIIKEIKRSVPMGSKWHKKTIDQKWMPENWPERKHDYTDFTEMPVISQEYSNAARQAGTLGSGNHFIEIQKGNDNYMWIMLHSGSRNLGKQVAVYYNRVAKRMAKKVPYEIPQKWELAYLPEETREAQQYIREMNYCVDFAFINRRLMMERIKQSITEIMGKKVGFDHIINIAHNYAAKETHFGEEVFVHRKGATSAQEGETGIIPGSQGTNSYIVEGLGNPESFTSCSHGAGRVMSRRQAIKNLSLQKETNFMNSRGIIHGINTQKHLDEAAGAYKNIKDVMKNQKDLVKILVELEPRAVIKG